GMGELPVAGAVADGVDARDARAPPRVGRNARSAIELDARSFEADPFDQRRPAGGDEHQVRADGLAVAEMDGELRSGVFDLRALHAEMQGDVAPAELLRELTRHVRVLLRDQGRERLDDRHLAPEPLEDRRELAADDPATENDQAGRN